MIWAILPLWSVSRFEYCNVYISHPHKKIDENRKKSSENDPTSVSQFFMFLLFALHAALSNSLHTSSYIVYYKIGARSSCLSRLSVNVS